MGKGNHAMPSGLENKQGNHGWALLARDGWQTSKRGRRKEMHIFDVGEGQPLNLEWDLNLVCGHYTKHGQGLGKLGFEACMRWECVCVKVDEKRCSKISMEA